MFQATHNKALGLCRLLNVSESLRFSESSVSLDLGRLCLDVCDR